MMFCWVDIFACFVSGFCDVLVMFQLGFEDGLFMFCWFGDGLMIFFSGFFVMFFVIFQLGFEMVLMMFCWFGTKDFVKPLVLSFCGF